MNAGEREKSATEVCSLIQRHMLDFSPHLALSQDKNPTYSGRKSQTIHWQRPAPNHVKVNFDAAFRETTGDGAWGFVARADDGEFIAAAAGKLKHLKDALQAEAEAGVAAVEGAAMLGFHRVQFESDSQTLVSALKSSSHELSEIGVLLRDARSRCFAAFDLFEFNYCQRTCNKVAHSLAKFGYEADTECLGWTDEVPPFVSDLVASDIAVHPV